jgi:HEXXH motif-containing protein
MARPHGGMKLPEDMPLDAEHKALNCFDRAYSLLCEVNPSIQPLLAKLVSNLVLRRDGSRPSEAWGATSGLAIGRILLVNADKATTLECTELLNHELVHIVIDCAELAEPFYLTPERNSSEWPSPWTGNPISIHALFHATIVWASLGDLWRSLSQYPEYMKTASKRLRFIESGFAALDVGAAKRAHSSSLHPKAFTAMNCAKEHALSGPQ